MRKPSEMKSYGSEHQDTVMRSDPASSHDNAFFFSPRPMMQRGPIRSKNTMEITSRTITATNTFMAAAGCLVILERQA